MKIIVQCSSSQNCPRSGQTSLVVTGAFFGLLYFDWTYCSSAFRFIVSSIYFYFLVTCARLSWLYCQPVLYEVLNMST